MHIYDSPCVHLFDHLHVSNPLEENLKEAMPIRTILIQICIDLYIPSHGSDMDKDVFGSHLLV